MIWVGLFLACIWTAIPVIAAWRRGDHASAVLVSGFVVLCSGIALAPMIALPVLFGLVIWIIAAALVEAFRALR